MRALKVSANTLNKSKNVEQDAGQRPGLSEPRTAAAGRRASPSKAARARKKRWPPSIAPRCAALEMLQASEARRGAAAQEAAEAGRGTLYLTTPQICCASTAAARTRTLRVGEMAAPIRATVTVNARRIPARRARPRRRREKAPPTRSSRRSCPWTRTRSGVVEKRVVARALLDGRGGHDRAPRVVDRRAVAPARRVGEGQVRRDPRPPQAPAEAVETDVASQAIAVAGAVSSYPVADLSAAECRAVLARHTTAKFADALDPPPASSCAGTRTAFACASRSMGAATTFSTPLAESAQVGARMIARWTCKFVDLLPFSPGSRSRDIVTGAEC